MPKDIYNEGRVVGMSAYEIYLRHQLSEYPDMEPVTEREWLSSTLGAGCSMILRIPKGTSGQYDKQLPDNSTLCAASQITGTVFDGQVQLDATNSWATKVVSYGPLISNTSDSHPTTPGDTVPSGSAWQEAQRKHLAEYMKIIDGLVFQPGTWSENEAEDKSPAMDFAEPDLNKRGTVRINISKPLDRDVYVLLTGWVHRPMVAGSTKIEEGALNLIHPWNGDFLGAERFPWAVKITFVIPTEVMHVLNDKAYIRQMAKGRALLEVTAKPIVDYDSTDIQQFYASGDKTTYKDAIAKANADGSMYTPQGVSDSRVQIYVKEFNTTGDAVSVLGAYQRGDVSISGNPKLTGADYPPILYGAKVKNSGDQYVVPIDTGAPGTVKMFENKEKAIAYPKIIPNTYAFWHDQATKSIYFIEGNETISLDTKLETKNIGSGADPYYASIVKSGDKQVTALSLANTDGKTLLKFDGDSAVPPVQVYTEHDDSGRKGNRNICWKDLLIALGSNRYIDVIGNELHRFRRNLPNVTSGEGGVLQIKGEGRSYINGDLLIKKQLLVNGEANVEGVLHARNSIDVSPSADGIHAKTSSNQFIFNKPIRSGSNYIEFTQPGGGVLRLYITGSAPKQDGSIPVGSIGIGW